MVQAFVEYTYVRVQGRYVKPFESIPLDGAGAEILSFPVGTSVTFVAWKESTTVEVISRAATILSRPDGAQYFHCEAEPPDLDNPGIYHVRWDVTYPPHAATDSDTWPVPGYETLLIQSATP